MVHQIALARTDVRISERLVNLERLSLKPLAVLIVKSLLSNLTDVNLRVEVCRESLVVVSGVAVNDVKILNIVEVMLCGISCVDAANARVEAAAKDGGKSGLLKAVFVCPLQLYSK